MPMISTATGRRFVIAYEDTDGNVVILRGGTFLTVESTVERDMVDTYSSTAYRTFKPSRFWDVTVRFTQVEGLTTERGAAGDRSDGVAALPLAGGA